MTADPKATIGGRSTRGAGGLEQLAGAAATLQAELVAELRSIRLQLERLSNPPAAYSIAEFAEICSVSARTVRRAIDAGEIPVIRFGDRSVRIPSSVLTGEWKAGRSAS